jgi:hypothetical protein
MTDLLPSRRRNARAAVALRLAGATYPEIADTLEIDTPDKARELIERELAANGMDDNRRHNLREEEAARIMRLMRGVWGKATDPENPEHLPATRVALALIDRHARLMGLDAPQEVVVYTPTTTEIDQWVADMLTRSTDGQFDVKEPDVILGETETPPPEPVEGPQRVHA